MMSGHKFRDGRAHPVKKHAGPFLRNIMPFYFVTARGYPGGQILWSSRMDVHPFYKPYAYIAPTYDAFWMDVSSVPILGESDFTW
jgi:hypothetical protein